MTRDELLWLLEEHLQVMDNQTCWTCPGPEMHDILRLLEFPNPKGQ